MTPPSQPSQRSGAAGRIDDAGCRSGPVALVTGAAGGIGSACVAELVDRGWRVAAVDLAGEPSAGADPARGRDSDSFCPRVFCPGVADVRVADVRDQAALDAVVSDVVAAHGRLDAVVAVAGVLGSGGALWELDDDEWYDVVETDLTGVWRTVRSALPHVLASPGPRRIVAVTSAAGSLGLRHLGAYAAAKHGVIGLVRSLAADLAGTGVTANAVAPGSTRTSMLEQSAEVYGFDDVEEFVQHQEPLGRLIEPLEVAAAIGWLCSFEAAAITGAVLPVDGGMTATN